jgi:hypothetical protein
MRAMRDLAADVASAWPEEQTWEKLDTAQIALTRFADFASYHDALRDAVLAAAEESAFFDPAHRLSPASCGRKVRDVAGWDAPAARFIHARAMAFAQRALRRPQVFADDTWASIYGKGDYCMPHSHIRADVSIVYMLEPGDAGTGDPQSGRLYFADPRIAWSCPVEEGRVIRPFIPEMTPGTMVMFGGQYVHGVHAYRGERARITMSWNITLEPRGGGARDWATRMAKAP